MQENEIDIKDLFLAVIRKWRFLFIFTLIAAILCGVGTAIYRSIAMHDEKKIALWDAEYNASYGAYWGAIREYDRQIAENSRQINSIQTQIDNLSRSRENLQSEISDTQASITYAETVISEYEADIHNLEQKKAEIEFYLADQNEWNENSIYMQIDPYHVQASVIFIRVDTGYQIIPESAYQNPDRTGEILQTYCMLVTNTEFFQQMIQDLNLDTEVRYLNELVSVSSYGDSSLRITVFGKSEDFTESAAEYIRDQLMKQHDMVNSTVAEHSIREYSHQCNSYIDLDVYTRQQDNLTTAINYENNIRDIDTNILELEKGIRTQQTDIREMENTIEDLQIEIDALPDLAASYESEIDKLKDTEYTLLSEQLELKKEPEPKYPGYTSVLSLITGFLKFAVIGGFIAMFVAALLVILPSITKGRIESASTMSILTKCHFFGLWPRGSKYRLDDLVDYFEGIAPFHRNDETLKELVFANVENAIPLSSGSLLICGDAEKDDIARIAESLSARLKGYQVLYSGDINSDPETVRNLSACSCVLLVARRSVSDNNSINTLMQRAETLNKPIIGFIIL